MPMSATRFLGRAFSVQERTLVREPVQDPPRRRDAGVADSHVSQTLVWDMEDEGRGGAGAYQRAVKRATRA